MKDQQEQINIELDEKQLKEFIPTAIINHSSEFVLDFVSIMPGIPKAKSEIKNCLDTTACKDCLKQWRNIHVLKSLMAKLKIVNNLLFRLILVLQDKHS
jgi:uncharacterized protein YpuA (DUF1002 family)